MSPTATKNSAPRVGPMPGKLVRIRASGRAKKRCPISSSYAGLVEQVWEADGALRAARRHPGGVPPSWVLAHLPQLLTVRVLQGTLNKQSVESYAQFDRREYAAHLYGTLRYSSVDGEDGIQCGLRMISSSR
jgi:hypothetical protein